MPLKYNANGSLDLYFQNESPGADKETNWLPGPKAPFNLTMRTYAPKSEAITGKWTKFFHNGAAFFGAASGAHCCRAAGLFYGKASLPLSHSHR